MTTSRLIVRQLNQQPYEACWQRMQQFTAQRGPESLDEIWLVQHPPVFTQGQAGKAEHILARSEIPVVQVDRGGQVTYHGPGQLVAYVLLDLKRRRLGVRDLVSHIENSIIAVLAAYGITAEARSDAPGVYVDGCKIASLGLRIRKGCSFHGLALNVDMDLAPFLQINPCGYAGLQMTQMAALTPAVELATVERQLIDALCNQLAVEQCRWQQGFER